MAILAALALGLRCLYIADRPVHSDEAVHAVILGEMLETGVYRYNPHDSHGPALYYLSYPFLWAWGVHALPEMEAWHLRLISALVGMAMVLTLALWARELGAGAVFAANVLLSVAAPFVYYQRYFIHEGLFVLLNLLLLRCLWLWFHARGSIGLGMATGTVSALLFATKETASLVFLALGLTACGMWLTLERRAINNGTPRLVSAKSAGWAILSFAFVFTLFYSSFGTNAHGLGDFVAAQSRFAHRATGEGHEKPWWTYLSWLLRPEFYTVPWSGWIIFGPAALGTVRRWVEPLIRFLFFFALSLGVIYSLIPYKTPWLEMNFLAPAVLLAGAGIDAIFQGMRKYKPIFALLVALGLSGLGRETWQTCFAHAADPRNPLAYAPTVGDVEQLAVRVAQLKKNAPRDSGCIIQVISTDYWPLPWYLRGLGPVGYWSEVPPTITGDIVIASPDLLPALQSKIGPGWQIEYFGLRPEVLAVVLSKTVPP